MDIGQLVAMLSHMARQAGEAINDKMNGNDLLNPE
ncbi:EscF/YscF/HrpA family type III secretion system needle major subunit, partial [Salmonella enterica]|nr:EscF/YscF/HrpA family type III secretion system needle major subunit [Salmonella enterica]